MRRGARALGYALLLSCCAALPALAQDDDNDELFEQTRTTYGDIGLIEMPTARMAPDGQMALTVANVDPRQWRIGLGFQLLPWIETSFRYSHIPHFFGSGLPLYDRSFGLKVRLFQETPYTPALAIGARDIVGTGIYGQEFIVLSKRFWDFDFTGGLGWGRLASTEMFPNPFGTLFQSFNTRTTNTGQGGTIAFNQLFHGPDTSLFGGINWKTPIDGLNLLVEYSPDRYLQERVNTRFFTRMPVNIAANYQVFSHMSVMAGYLYGTTWGAAITIHFDPREPLYLQKITTPPLPPAIRDSQQRQSALDDLTKKNRVVLLNSNGLPQGFATNPTELKDVLASVPSSAARDYEVDGRTLAINVDGPVDTDAQCRIFAQVVANATSGIDTIAITDLSAHDGGVTLCPVRPDQPAASQNLTAMAANDATASDASADAPVLDEQTLQFRPRVTDPHRAEQRIQQDAEAQNLGIEAVSVANNTALVYLENTKYYFEAEAIGRLARVLLSDTPAEIEAFRIVSVYHGVPMRETKLLRSDLERVINFHGAAAEIRDALSITDAPLDNPLLDAQATYPRFGWSIYPRLIRSFFDPEKPARFGIFADVSGYVEPIRGLTLQGTLEGNIYNDLGTNQPSNSLLPHVRSDFGLYYDHGANGIAELDAVYRTRLASDLFAEVKGGYLEDMFMGAGAQVLWRPNGQRWALGLDVYQVWQRGFDRLFDIASLPPPGQPNSPHLEEYQTVTGHAAIYYESPWFGLNFQVLGGKYLAGDWGGTFQISRKFSTGVEVGAFATFTNVPFSKFGEGSFDKGVVVRIPLEWILPINTQSAANLDFRPLTRDGGQRLENDNSLYDETRRTSYGEIDEKADEIVSP
jgi:hypothetical protein